MSSYTSAGPNLSHWRSPPTHETPLLETEALPPFSSPQLPQAGLTGDAKLEEDGLLHPSFLPVCKHSEEDGDVHQHAYDLLALSASKLSTQSPDPPESPSMSAVAQPVIASSVPNGSMMGHVKVQKGFAAPANGGHAAATNQAIGAPPKARRMSSTTATSLGRGKLGLLGGDIVDNKEIRATLPHSMSYSNTTTASGPIPNRRPSFNPTTSAGPRLYDWAKTDHRSASRPSNGHKARSGSITSAPRAAVPASLPANGHLAAQIHRSNNGLPSPGDSAIQDFDDDFEGDDEDGADGEDESAMDLDLEDEDGEVKPEWRKLALGTGSGGVKGRRKGEVFRCEKCGKDYKHPSCLRKHRWEHSPHWKEPGQLSMSKHQQVQMLEAATILDHLAGTRKPLPEDKSLWPMVVDESGNLRRMSVSRVMSGPPNMRSPTIGTMPLTPSSLRETVPLGQLANGQAPKPRDQPRRPSPGSDSTTSSMGDGYVAHPPRTSIGMAMSARPVGITGPTSTSLDPNSSSLSSSQPGPGTPHSIGSLPDMAGLNFANGTPHTHNIGVSPIPNRGLPLSVSARQGLPGQGMFGRVVIPPRDSNERGGGDDDDVIASIKGRGKTSSEEREERRREREGEEQFGMAQDMEL